MTSATIVPEGDAVGKITHADPLKGIDLSYDTSTRGRLRIESLVKVCCAGPIAQKKFKPRSYRSYHGALDEEQALDVLMRLCGNSEEISAYWKLLHVQTVNAINLPHVWNAVCAVANTLLERQTLTGAQVRKAINHSIQTRSPDPLPD